VASPEADWSPRSVLVEAFSVSQNLSALPKSSNSDRMWISARCLLSARFPGVCPGGDVGVDAERLSPAYRPAHRRQLAGIRPTLPLTWALRVDRCRLVSLGAAKWSSMLRTVWGLRVYVPGCGGVGPGPHGLIFTNTHQAPLRPPHVQPPLARQRRRDQSRRRRRPRVRPISPRDGPLSLGLRRMSMCPRPALMRALVTGYCPSGRGRGPSTWWQTLPSTR